MDVQAYELDSGRCDIPGSEIQGFDTHRLHKQRWPFEVRAPLTKREKFIMRQVAQGYPNQIIAEQSFISVNTVKFHMKNIFVKLGASNRTQAVQLYQGF